MKAKVVQLDPSSVQTYYYSDRNHSGLGLKSMVVSKITKCKMVPAQNLRKRF